MSLSLLGLCVCNQTEIPKGLESLASQCAPQQKAIHLLSDDPSAARYLLSELAPIGQKELFVLYRNPNGEIIGACTLAPLHWDSEIYGMKMGKVDWLLAAGDADQRRKAKHELAVTIVKEAQGRGYHHLSARIPAVEHDSAHVLEDAGFHTMDAQVTLVLDEPVACDNVLLDSLAISPFEKSDLDTLLNFSTDAYLESRLFVDPNLPIERTRRLHRQWVENDCLGRAAVVFVARLGQHPVGYIACLLHRAEMEHGKTGFGDIDLIAVNPSARGRGIALALVRTALTWFAKRVGRVTVKTQVTNYPALALYQRAGFSLQQAFKTLHLSLPSD